MLKHFSFVILLLCVSSAYGRVPSYPPKDSGICNSCLFGVRAVEDFLCDPAATDFLVNFVDKNICPSIAEEKQCHNLAEGLIPTIVDWFRSSVSPATLCSDTGVCGSDILSVKYFNQPSLRVKDGSTCAMCEFVVSQAKFALNNSNAIGEVKKEGIEACAQLPTVLAKTCVQFVIDNIGIISHFVNDVTPQQVCGLIGVCPSVFNEVRPLPLPATLVTAAMQSSPRHRGSLVAALSEIGDAELRIAAATGGAIESGQVCNFCEMAVLEAKAVLANRIFQGQVLNYTKALCQQVPNYEPICEFYVEQYVPILFSLLQQYLVPDLLCGEAGLCPTAPVTSVNAFIDFFQRFIDSLSGSASTQRLVLPNVQ